MELSKALDTIKQDLLTAKFYATGKTTIWESKKQKILDVEMNNAFSFHEYVASSCKKAGKKLCVQIRKTF